MFIIYAQNKSSMEHNTKKRTKQICRQDTCADCENDYVNLLKSIWYTKMLLFMKRLILTKEMKDLLFYTYVIQLTIIELIKSYRFMSSRDVTHDQLRIQWWTKYSVISFLQSWYRKDNTRIKCRGSIQGGRKRCRFSGIETFSLLCALNESYTEYADLEYLFGGRYSSLPERYYCILEQSTNTMHYQFYGNRFVVTFYYHCFCSVPIDL